MRAALALAIGTAGAVAGLSGAFAADGGFAPVDITARPIDAFQIDPGTSLEYQGGLVLSSRDGNFGSWSGLDFGSDGGLYAIADDGEWLRLKLQEADGRLTGIASAEMAPLLDDGGNPIRRKVGSDAEGLRIVSQNGVDVAYVSLEQVPDVRVFVGPDFVRARPTHLKLPPGIHGMPANQGLEAIALAPKDGPLAGAVVVIAEHFLDTAGNHRGFILDGPGAGTFTLKRSDDFDVSDAAFLANGDLLVLERKFEFPTGFAMRLRRIPGASVNSGALLDGPVVLQADGAEGVDNMEGLAVRPGPDGSAIIDLISDDNHSFLERTILLQFALKQPAPLVPRLRPSEAALE